MADWEYASELIKEKNSLSYHPFQYDPAKEKLLDIQNSSCMHTFDWQYFYEDIWCAKKIYEYNPDWHWDVGSSVDGFISHLLSFRENINLIDIRPIQSDIEGVCYTCADATDMSGIEDESIESLSALCSVEHFGLGRYGDPIDPNAWSKALHSFERVVKPGGHLYISVPVGNKNRLCFNAHRVFEIDTIINTFQDMELLELSMVVNYTLEKVLWKDDDTVKRNEEILDLLKSGKLNMNFGMFEFVKR
ncbi:MAG: DUF268 domain-containing protein [Lachnospiraceae bacterium]|nr:DUF268 domain-containing protein [Lachnospiraceae bacterium]